MPVPIGDGLLHRDPKDINEHLAVSYKSVLCMMAHSVRLLFHEIISMSIIAFICAVLTDVI